MAGISASWALVALHLLSKPEILDETVTLGSAHLLGLIIERAQITRDNAFEENAKRAENELKRLKFIRAEDAKANEKVVAIFASREQSWLAERKVLKGEIQSLLAKNEEVVSSLNYRIIEAECEIRKTKDEAIEEEIRKRKELEEKLEAAKKGALGNLQELRKAKQELDEMLETKEEAISTVQKMRNDSEQKDKMLSALLRKSKIDADEKKMLLKDVKMSKAKKQQAELEVERWKNKCELRNERGLRSSYSIEAGCSHERNEESRFQRSKSVLFDYFESELQQEHGFSKIKGENVAAAIKCLDQYSSDEPAITLDNQNLQDWVRLETEKYAAIVERKHFTEIEAFAEQMRLKDEKLEALRWRLLSKDIESKRLLSQIEGIEENLSYLRDEILTLEALLLDKKEEINCLKDKFDILMHHFQMNFAMKKQSEIDDAKADSTRNSYSRETNIIEEATVIASGDFTENYSDQIIIELAGNNSTGSTPSTNYSVDNSIIRFNEIYPEEAESVDSYGDEAKSVTFITNSPKQEIAEEKDVSIDLIHSPSLNNSIKEANISSTRKETSLKMDIQALGVSYKIKRLKQQLLMLEKLAESSKEKRVDENKQHLKGIMLVIHLLNKQVKRFQTLEEKSDDLSKRMHENNRGGNLSESHNEKEQRRVLVSFLEETFQLQRYMVATGQKLMDMQSKIVSSISDSSDGVDESAGFNTGQFADVIKSLFREIQRGLEMRIARMIGDLEGTLARDRIRHI